MELFHFDPVEIGVIIAGFLATGAVLKHESKRQGKVLEQVGAVLSTLNGTAARLTALMEQHESRITRLERQEDQK